MHILLGLIHRVHKAIVSFFQGTAYLASAINVIKTGSRSKRMPFPARQDTLVFCIPETLTDGWKFPIRKWDNLDINWDFLTPWDSPGHLFMPNGSQRSPQASALWGEGGACVFQVPSTSHFLLFWHIVIVMVFMQTWSRVYPNFPQMCTPHTKYLQEL